MGGKARVKKSLKAVQAAQASAGAPKPQQPGSRRLARPSVKAASATPSVPVPAQRFRGTVKRIMEAKGFGFIDQELDGPDIFFRLSDSIVTNLREGMLVSFHVVTESSGRQRASDIRRAERSARAMTSAAGPTAGSGSRHAGHSGARRRRRPDRTCGPALSLGSGPKGGAASVEPPTTTSGSAVKLERDEAPGGAWLSGDVVTCLRSGEGLIKPPGSRDATRRAWFSSSIGRSVENLDTGMSVQYRIVPGRTRTVGSREELCYVVSHMRVAGDEEGELPAGNAAIGRVLQRLSKGFNQEKLAMTEAPPPPHAKAGMGDAKAASLCKLRDGDVTAAEALLASIIDDPDKAVLERSNLGGLMNRPDLLAAPSVQDSLLCLFATKEARGRVESRCTHVYDQLKLSAFFLDPSHLRAHVAAFGLRPVPDDASLHPADEPATRCGKVLHHIAADSTVRVANIMPLVVALRGFVRCMVPGPSKALLQAVSAASARLERRTGTPLSPLTAPVSGEAPPSIALTQAQPQLEAIPHGGSVGDAVQPTADGFRQAALAWARVALPCLPSGTPNDPLWDPATDFRSLSVFPSAAEVLTSEQPPLAALKVQGAYNSPQEYLDAHFRLLREDCVAPLRAGIAAYLNDKAREVIVRAQYKYAKAHSLPLHQLPPPPPPLPPSRDVNVYPHVKLVGLVPSFSKLVYRIQLPVQAATADIDWHRSKRLMYGSLLLLSANDFGFCPLPGPDGGAVSQATLLWATVQNRDPDLMSSRRQLDIAFPDGYEPRLHTLLQRCVQEAGGDAQEAESLPEPTALHFTVVESAATYFEAYRHTLRALQCVDVDAFGTNTLFDGLLCPPRVVLPPAYLTPHLSYPERCSWAHAAAAALQPASATIQTGAGSVRPEAWQPLSGAPDAYPHPPPANPLLALKFPDAYRFPSLVPQLKEQTGQHWLRVLRSKWPLAPDGEAESGPGKAPVSLDASQLSAFQQSLTRELALVQGPPGTGKTFVGLKVVRALLDNVVPRLSARPILVVCFTNHALDQFMSGILEVTTNVVRIGSRSKEARLAPYNLKEMVAQRLQQHQAASRTAAHAADAAAAAKSVQAASAAASATLMHAHRRIKRQLWDLRDQIFDAAVGMGSRVMSRADTADAALSYQFKSLWEGYTPPDIDGESDDEAFIEAHEEAEYEHLVEWLGADPLVVTDGPEGAEAAASVIDGHMATQAAVEEANARLESTAAAVLRPMLPRQHATSAPSPLLALGGGLPTSKAASDQDRFVLSALGPENAPGASGATEDDDEEEVQRIQDDRIVGDAAPTSQPAAGQLPSTAGRQSAPQGSQRKELTPAPIFPPPLPLNDRRGLEVGSERGAASRHEPKAAGIRMLPPLQLEEVEDVWALPLHERQRLYRVWVWRRFRTSQHALADLCQRFARVQKQLEAFTQSIQLDILGRASVIGMTTTATAKYQGLIHALKPEVVIVEEAAEVLESHLVTALTSATKHMVLIGDHQQLRPGTAVHALAKDKHLEVSLFERLVLNGVPHVTLQRQRRMRPEVSRLITPLYPALRDHPVVMGSGRPHVQGMAADVFFFSHTFREDTSGSSSSKRNTREAVMVAKLAGYLLSQGHSPESITVLAAYVGQLMLLKRLLQEAGAGAVRATTVDNYQGEEADIILLSLVRSNSHGAIGFLAEDNRACVALSRARRGMYMFGDGEMLRARSRFWETVMDRLTGASQCGPSLPLAPGWDGNAAEGGAPPVWWVTDASHFP